MIGFLSTSPPPTSTASRTSCEGLSVPIPLPERSATISSASTRRPVRWGGFPLAAECRSPADLGGLKDRPFDADPAKAAVFSRRTSCLDDAPEADAESAGHEGLQRRLRCEAACRCEASHGAQHRLGAAGGEVKAPGRGEKPLDGGRHQGALAGAAVFGRDVDLAALAEP